MCIIISSCIYPAYNKQNEKGKLIIALFSPLIMVAFKTTSSSYLCSETLEKNRPSLFLRYDGAIVRCLSDHVPGYAGGSRQLKSHCLSWNNSRRCGSHRTKHSCCHRSHMSTNPETRLSSLRALPNSAYRENNGGYRYYEHAL